MKENNRFVQESSIFAKKKVTIDGDFINGVRFHWLCVEEIKKAINAGLDIDKLLNPKLNHRNLEEIRLSMMDNSFHDSMLNPNLNINDLRLIREAVRNNLDVSKLADDKFNFDQRNEIYLGLLSGVDVTKYNNPKLDWFVMKRIRESISPNGK